MIGDVVDSLDLGELLRGESISGHLWGVGEGVRVSRLSGISEGECSQLERSLGEGKEQRQPFRIPGEEQPFMHQASIQAPTEPAEFQG